MDRKKHIRVIGPSSHVNPEQIQTAVQWLEDKGFSISVDPQVFNRDYQSAGPVEEKVNALHNAFSDNEIDIIFTSCGGNGAIHLLPFLDFDLIKTNPKPLIGFSDITILLNAIYAKTSLTTFHGPTLTQIQKPLPDAQLDQCLQLLSSEFNPITWNECEPINTGKAKGRLIGGNLSVFQTLLGTPYCPIQDDKNYILFLEDVGDQISRYDRMLAHLKISGVLDKVSAIFIGDMQYNDDLGRVPFGRDLETIIRENTQGLDIPIAMNCPFGHRGQLWTLPIGHTATVTIQNNSVELAFN